MKNILLIVEKELLRFFKDKRLIITVLMPGLLIFVLYSVMGEIIDDADTPTSYTACVYNMPEDESFKTNARSFLVIEEHSLKDAKKAVQDGELDLLIIFPEDFDEVLKGQGTGAKVEVFYNSGETSSALAYSVFNGFLSGYNTQSFYINAEGEHDLVDAKQFSQKLYATIMPILMFSLIASGCIAVVPECIAGEKERGTLATILITPIKRWQLALGKVFGTTCITLLSALSGFIGVVLSLPKITGGSINIAFSQYVLLLLVLLSVVFVINTVFAAVSAFAKDVKEASGLIVPFMIIIILFGVAAMLFSSPALGLYAIPLFGASIGISGILTGTVPALGLVLAFLSDVVLGVAMTVLISFMFNNERIMFNN